MRPPYCVSESSAFMAQIFTRRLGTCGEDRSDENVSEENSHRERVCTDVDAFDNVFAFLLFMSCIIALLAAPASLSYNCITHLYCLIEVQVNREKKSNNIISNIIFIYRECNAAAVFCPVS